MNKVCLIGRLTKGIDASGSRSDLTIVRFTVAIDRRDKENNADFINCTAFGKLADLMSKYCYKGQLIGVEGSIRTGSYEKDGKKVYTTNVTADRVEFLSRQETKTNEPVSGFEYTDEDIQF